MTLNPDSDPHPKVHNFNNYLTLTLTLIQNSPNPSPKAVFYGHLKQEDMGSLPVSSEKSMFYGQPKQED